MFERTQFQVILTVSHNVYSISISKLYMMKLPAIIFALCSTITVAFAGQSILLNATHPDHPGKCYDSASNIALNPDETKTIPGSCSEAFCSRDFSLTYTSCIVYTLDDPNCEKIEQDFTKDYPECCKKYKCVHDGKVSYH